MKKIISLGLAVLMIVLAMASCKDDKTGDTSSTPSDSIPGTPVASTPAATPEETPAESTPETGNNSEDVVLEDCDETVYVVDVKTLFLRSEPSFDDDAVAGTVEYGTELRRIGKGDVWSKVVYENLEYYISSKYISTEKPVEIVFEDCDETVYVTADAFYRSIPSLAEGAKVDTFAKGTELKRTGVMYEEQDAENNPDGTYGWSRIEYEGKTYYMRNSVLSTEAPSASESAPAESTPADTTAND